MMGKVPISIIITVKNEEKHIKDLLESILIQEEPFEVVIVDAESKDNTVKYIKEYEKKMDLKLIVKKCTRGGGRNIGVNNSKFPYVAFTDGDSILEKNWLSEIRKSINDGYDVIAGKTIPTGNKNFSNFDRVKIFLNGIDVTFPSCNLAYKKDLFITLGGFDERFITAEDIDLNYRAIKSGAKFYYNENAIVYNRTRDDIGSFLRQAFWNGYGREQLRKKHGNLWKSYSLVNVFSHGQLSIFGIGRMLFALSGYLYAKITFSLENE